jgi:hypothetical protein
VTTEGLLWTSVLLMVTSMGVVENDVERLRWLM